MTGRVITTIEIQKWFKEAKRDWIAPSLKSLERFSQFLNSPIVRDKTVRDKFFASADVAFEEERQRSAAATLLLEHANKVIKKYEIIKLMMRLPDECEQNLEARMGKDSVAALKTTQEALPYLTTIAADTFYRDRYKKDGLPWHFFAHEIFKISLRAWEDAGNTEIIGKDQNSPAAKVVHEALSAVNLQVGISLSNIEKALAGWPDPFPSFDGAGYDALMSGGFDYVRGKRVYEITPSKKNEALANKKKRGRPPAKRT